MRLATNNVNGINGRLPVLLEWLAATRPDVVCLQELKAPDERFPAVAIEQADYNIIPTPADVYQPERWIELA